MKILKKYDRIDIFSVTFDVIILN